MLMFIMYLLGAISILIQLVSAKKAFASKNYYDIKDTVFDVLTDGAVFVFAMNGGVGGFYIAVMASFMMTVYLKLTRHHEGKIQPLWWRLITGQKKEKV